MDVFVVCFRGYYNTKNTNIYVKTQGSAEHQRDRKFTFFKRNKKKQGGINVGESSNGRMHPSQTKKVQTIGNRNEKRNVRCSTNYRGIVPFSLRSRLLAPTERQYVPGGRIHDWDTTSHIDRSYLERVIVTVCDAPGDSSTSVKPRRTDGGSPARTG
jgi:hypothetical protein